jgi:very-short-patch-repair endonuclease
VQSVDELFRSSDGYVTTGALLQVITRQQLDVQVKKRQLIRVWHGVYARTEPNAIGRLTALDVYLGQPAVACMGTAAGLYGFDTETPTRIHVLDPGVRVRPTAGLMVHQRSDAPLRRVRGRLAAAPAWTAVEVARELYRPRALATLDAALHSGSCTLAELNSAIAEQRGRRGIVAVRDLVQHADGRAESAMESEARLVMLDHGLPRPELQYVIAGSAGQSWRVDFAWPDHGVVAEYESIDWHAGGAEMLRDKRRFAAIQQLGWTVIPIVVTDVRQYPVQLADRIAHHLSRSALAS